MSRAKWINELVDAGYEPGVLDQLNNNELAELVQEEFIENTWSPEARAAAVAARHKRAGLTPAKRTQVAKEIRGLRKLKATHPAFKSYTKKQFKKQVEEYKSRAKHAQKVAAEGKRVGGGSRFTEGGRTGRFSNKR